MIDISAAQDVIAGLIRTQIGDRCQVYARALDALPSFPLVALGVPEFTPDVQPCADLITLPVAVVVSIGDAVQLSYAQDQLQDLWSEMITGLREDLITHGPGLGVAQNAVIKRAQFAPFPVQGKDHPAMVTLLDLYG